MDVNWTLLHKISAGPSRKAIVGHAPTEPTSTLTTATRTPASKRFVKARGLAGSPLSFSPSRTTQSRLRNSSCRPRLPLGRATRRTCAQTPPSRSGMPKDVDNLIGPVDRNTLLMAKHRQHKPKPPAPNVTNTSNTADRAPRSPSEHGTHPHLAPLSLATCQELSRVTGIYTQPRTFPNRNTKTAANMLAGSLEHPSTPFRGRS